MSPRTATFLRWSLLALAGLVAAVAVGVAAAALTSQQIGLSSEPVRAGEALAPKSAKPEDRGKSGKDRGKRGGGHDDSSTTTTTPTTTTTAPPPTTTVPTTTVPRADHDHRRLQRQAAAVTAMTTEPIREREPSPEPDRRSLLRLPSSPPANLAAMAPLPARRPG